MYGFRISIGLIALATVCTVAAQDAEDTSVKRGWGLTAGVFVPADSTVRDTFGNTWLSFGIRPLNFGGKSRDWKITGDLNILTASRNGNRVLAIPATLGVTKVFDGGGDSVPFVSVAAGPAYYDYSILGTATKRVGWNANVRGGVTFSKRLQLQARYDFYSPTDGLRFDGLTLSLAYQAFRF